MNESIAMLLTKINEIYEREKANEIVNKQVKSAKIYESKSRAYYIFEDGKVEYYGRFFDTKELIPFIYKGNLIVRFADKNHIIKNLVAKYFIDDCLKGKKVINIDGNPYNCHVSNLKILEVKKQKVTIPKELLPLLNEISKQTGMNKTLIINTIIQNAIYNEFKKFS